MAIVSTILNIVFIVLCILLVLVILVQSNRSSGMGLFGGGANSAFGAGSADVITKATGVMVGIFFIIALAMPFFHTKSGLDASKLSQKEESKKEQTLESKTDDKAKLDDKTKTDANSKQENKTNTQQTTNNKPVENKTENKTNDANKPK